MEGKGKDSGPTPASISAVCKCITLGIKSYFDGRVSLNTNLCNYYSIEESTVRMKGGSLMYYNLVVDSYLYDSRPNSLAETNYQRQTDTEGLKIPPTP